MQLKAKDVHIGRNKNKLLFVLFTSKMHGRNVKPQQIKIAEVSGANASSTVRNKNDQNCPFVVLKQYLQVRGKYSREDEQFFVFSDRSPVKPVHLYDMGVSVEDIKKIGRWRSSAVFNYLTN